MDLQSTTPASAWAERLARSAFAASLAKGAPVIVFAGGRSRVAFANKAALALFGASDAHELETQLFANSGFGARRLARLVRDAPASAPPRLEALTFYVSRKPTTFRWLCARLEREGDSWFVAAEPVSADDSQVEAAAPSPPRETPMPEPALAPEPLPAPTAPEPLPLDGPVRFVWRLDDQGRFGETDEALSQRLGTQAPRPGETLGDLVARAHLGEAWAEAVAGRATFSALRLAWPEPGGARARVALVSGAPIFERGAIFRGFRGFGLFTGEGVDLAPEPHEPSAPPAASAFASPAEPERPSIEGSQFEPLAETFETDARVAPPTPEAALPAHDIWTVSEGAAVDLPSSPAAVPSTPTEDEYDLPPWAVIDEVDAVVAGAEARQPAEPLAAAPPGEPARPVGDAAQLISMLQREHAPPPAEKPAPAAPAIAIISALAQLLQSKPGGAPASSAEVVQLRPPVANDSAPRDGATVALSSQERDAFKEIARALGANVRGARPDAPPETSNNALEETPPPASPNDLVALIDLLPIAALVIRDAEALYANQTLLDLTGYRDLDDFRRRDGLKAIFRGREPASLAPGGAVGGIPLVAAGGRLMTVDAQVRPARWQGAPAVMVALRRSYEAEHQDEIRALECETAMHATRARDFSTMLDAARDGMARLDHSGRLLGLNKGAEALFGCSQNEVAGESFLILFAPGGQATAGAALDRLVRAQSGPVETFEALARDRTGREFPARVDLGRIANQPEPDYFLLVTDRSERKSAPSAPAPVAAAPEADSAAKTELLSRVSHEMRTPLHAIMGFAEVILEERFGPLANERYRDYIRDIHASSKHVLSLANDLLDLTRIELGKLELNFAPVDVNRIIRECVTLMQPQAARERIIMRLSLYDRLPNVMADERSLRQIMLNLMSNAVKYNEPGGQVIVSTALDDAGAAIVRVRDTGVGMNESELAIALEPFRRVPGARQVEGSGLGLPLTKALVEANHADFTIKSRKDQGTLVEIAFPARHAAQ